MGCFYSDISTGDQDIFSWWGRGVEQLHQETKISSHGRVGESSYLPGDQDIFSWCCLYRYSTKMWDIRYFTMRPRDNLVVGYGKKTFYQETKIFSRGGVGESSYFTRRFSHGGGVVIKIFHQETKILSLLG